MLKELIAAIEAHLAWRKALDRPLGESTFGAKTVNDGKLLTRLRAGGDIGVKNMEAIMAFIAADHAEVEAAHRQDAAA